MLAVYHARQELVVDVRPGRRGASTIPNFLDVRKSMGDVLMGGVVSMVDYSMVFKWRMCRVCIN